MNLQPIAKTIRQTNVGVLLVLFLVVGQLRLELLSPIAMFASVASADDLPRLEEQAIQAAAARVADSLVQIQCVGGRQRVEGMSLGDGPGTGLIVSPDGLILTSRFHFAREPNAILVTLSDGDRLPARLVATDRSRGLVLLKVDLPAKNTPLRVPASASVASADPGAWALAVGRTFNPAEVNVSVGVISATNRIWGKAIQTDAKISPSNYGGALVDIYGRVWGLLVPLSPDRDGKVAGAAWYDSGIGFAIPYETIRKILPRLARGEDLDSGFLGISLVNEQNIFGMVPQIQQVHPDSPAAEAGLQKGDRIVAVDRQAVGNIAELKYQFKPHLAGDTVEILIDREGKQLGKKCILTNSSSIAWIKPPARQKKLSLPGQSPKPIKRDALDRL